jgi:hypothetical protein
MRIVAAVAAILALGYLFYTAVNLLGSVLVFS